MSLRRKITVGIVVALLGFAIYFVSRAIYVVRHVPEAYTAWDTGTLLVAYMEANDDRWPSSWDDLLSVTNRVPDVVREMRGVHTGETNYLSSLRNRVAIDWRFVPKIGFEGSPVTRPDGTAFPILWRGADPNQMIRTELQSSSATNAPKSS
jgi:hypothetical protein